MRSTTCASPKSRRQKGSDASSGLTAALRGPFDRARGGPGGWRILATPDWVCEVLSPSTAALDRSKKRAIYAREGVAHAWIVEPIAQTIEFLRLESRRWLIASTCAGTDAVRLEPFDALELDLTLLWEPR